MRALSLDGNNQLSIENNLYLTHVNYFHIVSLLPTKVLINLDRNATGTNESKRYFPIRFNEIG